MVLFICGRVIALKFTKKNCGREESVRLILEKIIFLHMKKNLTMKELSEEIDISQPTLSRFYN